MTALLELSSPPKGDWSVGRGFSRHPRRSVRVVGEITLPRTESQVLLEVQEEQLEQLHVQNELLRDIRKHTGLVYRMLMVWLILSLTASVAGLVAAIDAVR